jgi:hypothetical protein
MTNYESFLLTLIDKQKNYFVFTICALKVHESVIQEKIIDLKLPEDITYDNFRHRLDHSVVHNLLYSLLPLHEQKMGEIAKVESIHNIHVVKPKKG